MMEIQLKSEDGCVKTYSVEVPPEGWAPHVGKVLAELRGHAALPGFRQGKAPLAMIKARFRKEINEEVISHLLPEAAEEIEKRFGVHPAVDPRAGEISLVEGEPFRCEIVFEVAPAVPDLADLSTDVTAPKAVVEEDQIAKRLELLRERASVLKPVEGPAGEGDLVEMEVTRGGHGKPFPLLRAVAASGGNPPDAALAGKTAGESFALVVSEGGQEGEGSLAPGEYEVTVKKVSRRDVPDLGDELARHFSCESLDGLRSLVLKDLEAEAQEKGRRLTEERVLQALLARYPFDVPPTLVERRLREDLEEAAASLAMQGISPDHGSINWREIAASRRHVAEKEVKTYFLLEAVAAKHGLKVAEEELGAHLAGLAAARHGGRVTPQQVRAAYEKEGRLDSLRRFLLHRKALDLLLSSASVKVIDERSVAKEDSNAANPNGRGADEPR